MFCRHRERTRIENGCASVAVCGLKQRVRLTLTSYAMILGESRSRTFGGRWRLRWFLRQTCEGWGINFDLRTTRGKMALAMHGGPRLARLPTSLFFDHYGSLPCARTM